VCNTLLLLLPALFLLLLLLRTNGVFSTGGRDYFVIVYFMYHSGTLSFEDSIVRIFASADRLSQASEPLRCRMDCCAGHNLLREE